MMTPGARRVLQELADDDDTDIVCEGWKVYIGNRQTTHRVVKELIHLMAISVTSHDGFVTGMTYMNINSTGHALLRRPELEGELVAVLAQTTIRPFQIKNDRVSYLDD
jgi:hypothetical protein